MGLNYQLKMSYNPNILFNRRQSSLHTEINFASKSLPLLNRIRLQFFHKLRLQSHGAEAVDFTIDVMIAVNEANIFNTGPLF